MIIAETKIFDNYYWAEREREIAANHGLETSEVLQYDAYWEPLPEATLLEVQWDKARLDALEMAGRALLKGELSGDDIRTIAQTTAVIVDFGLPVYEDIDGMRYMPGMIVPFNEEMLTCLRVKGE